MNLVKQMFQAHMLQLSMYLLRRNLDQAGNLINPRQPTF